MLRNNITWIESILKFENCILTNQILTGNEIVIPKKSPNALHFSSNYFDKQVKEKLFFQTNIEQ